jgi:hypothetical protein
VFLQLTREQFTEIIAGVFVSLAYCYILGWFMDKKTIAFLRQTAEDYAMEYDDVKRIYRLYPFSEFYDNLELFIKNRCDRDGSGKI